MAKRRKIGKKLREAQAAGTLTDRQQKRIDFLNSKTQAAKGNKSAPAGQKGRYKGIRKDVKKGLRAEEQVQKENISTLNPTIQTATGGSTVTYDENGNPIYTETLSENQQNILNQGEAITQQGQQLASGLLSNYQAFGPQQYDRQSVEDAAFQRMTRFMNQDYDREKEALEQKLYNSGNPPGSPRYNEEMAQLQRRFDANKEQAALNAVAVGQSEQAQAFNQGLLGHQQGISDITTLQQQGSGFMAPNLPGYQAPNQLSNPNDLALAFDKLGLEKQQLDLQRQQVQGSLANQRLALQQQGQASAGPAGPVDTGGNTIT
jgi:hypothetical protein